MALSGGQRRTSAVLILVTALAFIGSGRVASAQGVGFQGGFTLDPEQVYVGSHFETAEIARGLHVRPGIDGAFGGDLAIASINVEFLYKYKLGPSWTIYQGGGPAIHIIRFERPDETDVTGGLTAVFGFAHASGLFTEFRVAGGGGHNLKFGVGYTLH